MDTTLRFVSDFLYTQLACFTGIEDLREYDLTIFPNPALDIITIKNNLSAPFQLSIYNMSGAVVMQVNSVFEKQINIPVSTLPSGVYWIQCANTKEVIRTKFIKTQY
jgi:hypothetical protein